MLMIHSFAPIFDENSSVLILGTFPSEESRKQEFYYGHPKNRFWKVISSITGANAIPETTTKKIDLLLENKIALWDVIQSCEIKNSSDATIKNVTVSDLDIILTKSNIKQIYSNGEKAYKIYMKHCYTKIQRNIIRLSSTSPANASYNLEKLLKEWTQLCYYL